jgi:hypothetical protein
MEERRIMLLPPLAVIVKLALPVLAMAALTALQVITIWGVMSFALGLVGGATAIEFYNLEHSYRHRQN